jgi:hypothetical protein
MADVFCHGNGQGCAEVCWNAFPTDGHLPAISSNHVLRAGAEPTLLNTAKNRNPYGRKGFKDSQSDSWNSTQKKIKQLNSKQDRVVGGDPNDFDTVSGFVHVLGGKVHFARAITNGHGRAPSLVNAKAGPKVQEDGAHMVWCGRMLSHMCMCSTKFPIAQRVWKHQQVTKKGPVCNGCILRYRESLSSA